MERRLAAILAADVVGYSRLMGADEAGTLATLKAHRAEFIDPKITEHKGRWRGVVSRFEIRCGSKAQADSHVVPPPEGVGGNAVPLAAESNYDFRELGDCPGSAVLNLCPDRG